jgi:D-aspartate ligase
MLVVNTGENPLRYSSLGIVRSLGRAGVPVFVFSPGRFYPDAISRFAAGHLDWISQGSRDPDVMASQLAERVSRIGARSVAAATDDEAAVLVAEYSDLLADQLVLPSIVPTLPRTLASKQGLSTICDQFGILTPATSYPKSGRDIDDFVARVPFPVVAKNVDPFTRLSQPAVPGTTLLSTKEELLALAATWTEPYEVVLQEYLPRQSSEDWFVHAYAASSTDELFLFTGRKMRSWPPHRGVTAYGLAIENVELAQIARGLLKSIDYRGPADLDWRRDLRDGGYRLVDFNPRIGAQFRVFQSSDGVDIPQLMHLDLTGRPLPAVRQVDGRRFIVEYYDVASRLFSLREKRGNKPVRARSEARTVNPTIRGRPREFAWFSRDDPMPFVVSLVRTIGEIITLSRRRKGRKRAQRLKLAFLRPGPTAARRNRA